MAVVKLQYKKLLLWTALVLQISLIFSFSLQNAKESTVISRWFTDGIKSRESYEQEVAQEKNSKGEQRYNDSVVGKVAKSRYSKLEHYVRKTAHFMLFFALGTILMLLLGVYDIKRFAGCSLSIMFGVAIGFFDETLQLFTKGRSGELRDVFIDSTGIAVAAIVILIGGLVYEKIKNRRSEMDN